MKKRQAREMLRFFWKTCFRDYKLFTAFMIAFTAVNLLLINSLYYAGVHCNPANVTSDCPAVQWVSNDSDLLNPVTLASSAFIHASEKHLNGNNSSFATTMLALFLLFPAYSVILGKKGRKQSVKGVKLVLSVFLLSVFVAKPIARTTAHFFNIPAYASSRFSLGFSGVASGLYGLMAVLLFLFTAETIRKALEKHHEDKLSRLFGKHARFLLAELVFLAFLLPLFNADFLTHSTSFILGWAAGWLAMRKEKLENLGEKVPYRNQTV